MTLFNNFGEYDAKEEAAKREALMKEFLDSDETHLVMTDENEQENENE